jgi:hypothetical protein
MRVVRLEYGYRNTSSVVFWAGFGAPPFNYIAFCCHGVTSVGDVVPISRSPFMHFGYEINKKQGKSKGKQSRLCKIRRTHLMMASFFFNSVEKQMECRVAGETEVLGENLPQRHFCPLQNPT